MYAGSRSQFFTKGGENPNPFKKTIFLVTKKIRNLGWQNNINIENSIKMTVDWLDQNRWIFKKRK